MTKRFGLATQDFHQQSIRTSTRAELENPKNELDSFGDVNHPTEVCGHCSHCYWRSLKNPNYIYIHIYLELQTTSSLRLFQLDDSKSLHAKWLFNQTSIKNWSFRVPGVYPNAATGYIVILKMSYMNLLVACIHLLQP